MSDKPPVYLLSQSSLDRLAYRRLIESELHLPVCADTDFTATAVWAAMRRRPRLALVLVDLPRPHVVDAVQMFGRLQPDVRTIVVSDTVEPEHVRPWADCALAGYVVKEGGLAELQVAVNAVLAGDAFFSAGLEAALRRQDDGDVGSRLSRREAELLPLLATGMTLRDAATRMTISYKTADSYRTSLLRKLGVRDRVELARYAIRHRIIEA